MFFIHKILGVFYLAKIDHVCFAFDIWFFILNYQVIYKINMPTDEGNSSEWSAPALPH